MHSKSTDEEDEDEDEEEEGTNRRLSVVLSLRTRTLSLLLAPVWTLPCRLCSADTVCRARDRSPVFVCACKPSKLTTGRQTPMGHGHFEMLLRLIGLRMLGKIQAGIAF